MPANKKALDLLGVEIKELHTKNESLKTKKGLSMKNGQNNLKQD